MKKTAAPAPAKAQRGKAVFLFYLFFSILSFFYMSVNARRALRTIFFILQFLCRGRFIRHMCRFIRRVMPIISAYMTIISARLPIYSAYRVSLRIFGTSVSKNPEKTKNAQDME